MQKICVHRTENIGRTLGEHIEDLVCDDADADDDGRDRVTESSAYRGYLIYLILKS